jgi:hypothetical protein
MPDHCDEFQDTFLARGLAGVRQKMMRYLHDTFDQVAGLHVTEPLKVAYTFEPYAFSRFNARTSLTMDDVTNFAKQPLAGEKICFAGEGFDYLNLGWQHGAVMRSEACFTTALAGLVPTATQNKWRECRNTDHVRLKLDDTDSVSNSCLFLNNEVDTAKLAGIDYCPDLELTAASTSAHDRPHAGDKGVRA